MSNSPAIWFQGFIKFLKNKLLFNNGASIEAGTLNPTSSAVSANSGSLYLSSTEKKLYLKDDNGNNTNWTEVSGGGGPVDNCRLLDIQVFTSDGTYTKNANALYVIVEAVGGGGSGGQASGAFSSNKSQGAGGGGGEYGLKVIDNDSIAATEAVTVGAGGSAGNGGTSSFGAHITAVGGNVGGTGSSASLSIGGIGGTGGTGGDLYIPGGDGGNSGTRATTSSNAPAYSGMGGASYLSGNAKCTNLEAGAGFTGKLYGGGGSGGHTNTSSAAAGGLGAAGIVIVREYGENE